MKLLKRLLRKVFGISKYAHLPKITLSAPTWNRSDAIIEQPELNPEAYNSLVREHKEVITPQSDDTPEILAMLMSQAACDREFPRVIVYPIDYDMRVKVEELLKQSDKKGLYPMYEYLPASIILNGELNSKTLIYKYRRSNYAKII